jgi:DNA-binding CsgD family transcriptional regulator
VFEALWVELAGDDGVVLLLEDVHWADEATLDVLRLLGRRVHGAAALVIVTYRDDELDRAHPLRRALGELDSHGELERVAIDPLSVAAVAELACDTGIDPGELYRRTAGNPFFVHEVLDAGGERVPESIRAAVLSRIAPASRAASEVVATVALAPPDAPVWLLERACGDAVASLDEALATGVLASVGNAVSFRHELAREAVAEAVSPARRLAIHRRLLDGLSLSPVGTPDAARLAHHAEAALDRDAVLRWAVVAAKEAAEARAYREAAAQYARALRFADGLPPDAIAELLEGRSRACYLADDQVEAIAVIEKAVSCRRDAGSPREQARALCELTSYLMCRGRLSEAESAVAEAERLVADQPPSTAAASVLAVRALLVYDQDIDRAVLLCRAAEELADAGGDPATAMDARVTRGSVELQRDRVLGRAILEDAVSSSQALGLREQAARALNNLGGYGVAVYDHDLANEFLPAALEYCVDNTLDLWRINVLALLARSLLDQGRWTEATEMAEWVLDDPRESPWPQHEAHLVLALVRGRRGDPDAFEALAAAEAVGVSPEETFALVDLAAARAELAWLAGRPEEIDRATRDALELAGGDGLDDGVAQLTFWRTRVGLEAERADPESPDPFVLAASGRWSAAASAWSRRGCPYETAFMRAHTEDEEELLDALAASRRLGARPLETLVSRRMRSLGIPIPRGPRPTTRSNSAHLTTRELDVLELLAEGYRNAEIAERLVVSRRTVDHHVSAILRKLEARTRGEAVARAAQLDLLQDR